jgi:NAD(P)-dependent dehydrogenase (short-subunit alcohol dehydrogenase family)
VSGSGKELDGKVAIVTGASRGIGLVTAGVLAGAGAQVLITDLPGTPLAEAAAAAGAFGTVTHHPVDIADEAAVGKLVTHAVDSFGRLDILNNNAARAGIPEDGDVVGMDVEVWDRMFAVNARGTMLMCKHAIPAMIAGACGAIVNISSGTAQAGQGKTTAYACTKAAIQTLTKYVATQYGASGVRCNAIAPGLVATEALRAGLPVPLQDAVVANKLVGRKGRRLVAGRLAAR